MLEILSEIRFEVAIALPIWLLTLLIPFRRMDTKAEIGWDLFAVLCAYVFAVVASELLYLPADWVTANIDRWYESLERRPMWLIVPCYIVTADFLLYWAHRLLHTTWLWPTHAFHHSAKHLYVISGLRASPIHVLLLLTPYVIAFVLFPVPEAGLTGIALMALQLANQHYIHSNIQIPWASAIEKIFVTPRIHFVHHSSTIRLSNSNYGFLFSVWDRLFGTYTDPGIISPDDELGLNYENSRWRLLLGLAPASRKSQPERQAE